MTLREYLKSTKQSVEGFAEGLSVGSSQVQSICSGRRFPSRKVAEEISAATDGLVSAAALLGLPEPESAAQ